MPADDPGGARRLLEAAPELRRVMRESATFRALRERQALTVDGERLYIVMGDALGDEEALLADALARGAGAQSPDPLARALYDELDDQLKAVVAARLHR